MSDQPRAVTGSVECDAEPDAVLDVIGDPSQLPVWAPGFADSVSGDATSGWRVSKDGNDFALRVPVDRAAGTADYLRAVGPGQETGAYLRAVGRLGGGTVLAMTLPVIGGATAAEVSAVLTGELATIVAIVEQRV